MYFLIPEKNIWTFYMSKHRKEFFRDEHPVTNLSLLDIHRPQHKFLVQNHILRRPKEPRVVSGEEIEEHLRSTDG